MTKRRRFWPYAPPATLCSY